MSAALLLDPAAHPIIGHRGASGHAPENTLAAFDLGLAHGAEAFECDVRLTRDRVPVICHDPTFERTAGRAEAVAGVDLEDLAGIDAGARFTPDGGRTFPYRDAGVRVPTLAEVLARYPMTPLLIELKVADAAGPVAAEVMRAQAVGRVVVASFLHQAVLPFRARPFAAGASRRDIVELTLRSWLGAKAGARAPGCYAVPIRYRDRIPVPTRRFVAAARRAGRPVHVWTVNDAATADRLWDVGCSGMITNFPEVLRAARDRRFGSQNAEPRGGRHGP